MKVSGYSVPKKISIIQILVKEQREGSRLDKRV